MGLRCAMCGCTKAQPVVVRTEKDFAGLTAYGEEMDYDSKEMQKRGAKGITGYYWKQLAQKEIHRHHVDKLSDVTFELLDDLLACQTNTIEASIKGEIQADFDGADQSNSIPCGPLARLNMACWAYFIMMEGDTESEPVNEIDCILVSLKREELRLHPYASPVVNLLDMDFNLESMKVTFTNRTPTDLNNDFLLVKSKNNMRTRSAYSRKHDGSQFNIRQAINNKFTNVYQEFGLKWVEKNNYTNPTLRQIVDGLKELFFCQIDQRQAAIPKEKIDVIKI